MTRLNGRFLAMLGAVLMLVLDAAPASTATQSYNWQSSEMTRSGVRELKQIKSLRSLRLRIDNQLHKPVPKTCADSECFDLHYFTNEGFDLADKARKNILYLPGGPGQIVKGPRGLPNFLAGAHNVAAFHLRGAGLSRLPAANRFDKYLAADYVVGDIEQLRIKLLGENGKWDAIYGFSYGTLIAQRYAQAHPEQVRRLILAAPVARNLDTSRPHIDQLLDNLGNIYALIRSADNQPCDCRERPLVARSVGLDGLEVVEPTDNFCFLKQNDLVERIKSKLKAIYERIEADYGSIGFVVQYFDRLRTDKSFTAAYPYPREFFNAMQQLQLLGAPQPSDALWFGERIQSAVNRAMVLGYFALMDDKELLAQQKKNFSGCRATGEFFKDANNARCSAKQSYCDRLKDARAQLSQPSEGTESRRALWVFGLRDGMNQLLFETAAAPRNIYAGDGCVTGSEVTQALSTGDPRHRWLRREGKKLGVIDGAERYCLWNPQQFRHKVPTLILKGGADAVIAGCQAENFFNQGLAEGARVFVEFPGMGHMPEIRYSSLLDEERLTPWGEAYRGLIDKFMTHSARDYSEDHAVKAHLAMLKALDRTPPPGIDLACGR